MLGQALYHGMIQMTLIKQRLEGRAQTEQRVHIAR